jgi:hypothetical protein
VRRGVEAVRDWVLASPRHAGYALALLALVVTVPFGGLAAAPADEPARRPAGTPVAAAPWELTLERALWGPELGGDFGPQDGLHHVVLVGTLRSTADSTLPASDLVGSVRVPGLPGAADGFGSPLEDGVLPSGTLWTLEPATVNLGAVAPGLTYDVGLHLTTTADTVPAELEVEVYAKTYRQSSLESTMLWTDEERTAVVTVPAQRSGPVWVSSWEALP